MSLDQVPDEIIQHLLYYVVPEDNLRCFQLLSRRLRALANQRLLWRYYCCTSYKYWNPEHRLQDKLRQAPTAADWRQLFQVRWRNNHVASKLLEGVLKTKVGRLKRMERICAMGYDAKDYLLVQCQVHETAPDVLARRYYSNAILDSIHRSIAIEEWYRLGLDRDPLEAQVASRRLERALGAFDMFVLHDQPGDLDDISRMLDDMAGRFLAGNPDVPALSTRDKALALWTWVRANNLTGLTDPIRNFQNLRNCLIGQALRHAEHESIPLISNAIYCCLAARVGLNAQCCPFPNHIFTAVFARPGFALDGKPLQDPDAPPQTMYLDAYSDHGEMSTPGVQSLLAQLGGGASAETFLAPLSTVAMVLKTAQHIKSTFARILELQDAAHPELSQLLRGNSAMNVEAAQYSAQWAVLMLTPPDTFEWDDRLASFLRGFAGAWPEDAWLVEKYLRPMSNSTRPLRAGFGRHVNRGLGDPWEHWRLVRVQDDLQPTVFRRNAGTNQMVPFRIGQVFRHRRYGWKGVITGWSDQGRRRVPVPTTNRNSSSPFHRCGQAPASNQFFFMCFPSTGSEPHVVADDNIEIICEPTQISHEMFPMAGKFFKRFDTATCTFISNIREQFPDD